MKNFFNSIPRKWKGIYLIWFSIQFILLMVSGHFFTLGEYFYPFYTDIGWLYSYSDKVNVPGLDFTNIHIYDLSEFFVYTLFPILIVLIIYYLKPDNLLSKARNIKEEIMSGAEMNLEGQEYHYSKDPTSLTKFLKAILWISLGIRVLLLLLGFMYEAEANNSSLQIMGILYLLYFIAFVVTGIAFLKWIRRANLNCHGFGAQGMEFTPGWSIGYYFIPFVSLYKPYRAMKEIWKVSTNPTNWQNEKGDPLLGWWWALLLISGFLWETSFRLSMQTDTFSSVSIISGIIDIPLYIVAVSLVSTIFTKQEKLVRKNV